VTQALDSQHADSLRRVIDSVFADAKYVWDRPRDPWAWLRSLVESFQRWLSALHEEHVVLYWLFVAALLLILGAIIAHATVLVYRAFRARPSSPERAQAASAARRDASWYLREAKRLELEGRLLESLAFRFSALVYRLEDSKALRVHPSKTPMEYVREASLDGDRRQAFAAIVREYYGHLFGGVPLDAAALAAFDTRMAGLTDRGATA
jgi:hypothetical protein